MSDLKITRIERNITKIVRKKPTKLQREIVDYLTSGGTLCSFNNSNCYPEMVMPNGSKKQLTRKTIEALEELKLIEITPKITGYGNLRIYHLPGVKV